jgi:hypothetical protein
MAKAYLRQDILEFLNKHKYDLNVDLARFLREEGGYGKASQKTVCDTILGMEKDSVLKILTPFGNLAVAKHAGTFENYKLPIEALIEDKGIKELFSLWQIDAADKVSKSTISTNKRMVVIGLFTILITGIIMRVGCLQYAKNDVDNRPELRSIDSSIQQLKRTLEQSKADSTLDLHPKKNAVKKK